MEIEIEIGDLDNLRRLQREYFTQNRRSTRTPIYLVQSETELACADDRGNSVGYWLIDDNEDEDPCLFKLKNSGQNEIEVRNEIEELVINDMEYYGKSDEEIEEKKKEMEKYFEEEMPDLNDYDCVIETIEALSESREDLKVIPYQIVWETRAICFTEQEALNYQSRQKHNLGKSQTYAMSPGYANYGHFLTLHKLIKGMRLLSDNDERVLCKDAIVTKLWRNEQYTLNIDIMVKGKGNHVTIKHVEKYSVGEEPNHLAFTDSMNNEWYLYDIPITELIKIRNYMFAD